MSGHTPGGPGTGTHWDRCRKGRVDPKSSFKPFVIYSGIYLSLETACVAQLQEAKRFEELEEKKKRAVGASINASGCFQRQSFLSN